MPASQLVLTREQSRRVDEIAIQQFFLPGIVLMENAGRHCADLIKAHQPTGPITILAGKGNNAGDGFVIARHLVNHGLAVRILLLCAPEEFQGDALINWNIVRSMEIPCERWNVGDASQQELISTSEWVVDALLGTGIRGVLREPFSSAIQRLNLLKGTSVKVFAVDFPSGLDCDTGQPCGTCVKADVTATFVSLKPGLVSSPGAELAGRIYVLDIGVPGEVIRLAAQNV